MERVLFRYFPYLKWENVIIASRKQMIRGDILIDDGVHNLVGGDYIRILMNAPHNSDFDEKAYGMTRVYGWEEIYAMITEMANS